jgi:hypothetical protein
LEEKICTREVEILLVLGTVMLSFDWITFVWDKKKDLVLLERRNIWFQDVIHHLQTSSKRYILEHPRIHYSHQILITAFIKNYPYTIPSILLDPYTIKLITIYPDRKRKKHFISLL